MKFPLFEVAFKTSSSQQPDPYPLRSLSIDTIEDAFEEVFNNISLRGNLFVYTTDKGVLIAIRKDALQYFTITEVINQRIN